MPSRAGHLIMHEAMRVRKEKTIYTDGRQVMQISTVFVPTQITISFETQRAKNQRGPDVHRPSLTDLTIPPFQGTVFDGTQ